MAGSQHRDPGFWGVQIPGWLLLMYLVSAQGVSALSYELGVSMGTQEPASAITEVGAAFWYSFAFGDLVFYIPLLAAGLIGQVRDAPWTGVVLGGALGITAYWPIVSLAALVDARGAAGWTVADEAPYWVVCVAIALWGGWALWTLVRNSGTGSQVRP